MFFWIINLFLITLYLFFGKKNSNIKLYVVLGWLFLLGAFRGENIGADYNSYKNFFEIYSHTEWNKLFIWGQEKGYIVLNKVISSFGGSYQLLLAVCQFLSLIGVIYFVKKNCRYYIMSIWLYITMFGYQNTYTRLRQSIALSIVLIAYSKAKEKKFIVFIILIFIATLFHKTAIISILIYPFINKRISIRYFVLGNILLVVGSLFRGIISKIVLLILSNSAYEYDLSSTISGGKLLIIDIIIMVGIFMIGYYYQSNFVVLDNDFSLIFYFSLFTVIFQVGALYTPVLNRLTDYFSVPLFLLVPNIFNKFDIKSRNILVIILFLLTIVMYIYQLNSSETLKEYYTFWMNK